MGQRHLFSMYIENQPHATNGSPMRGWLRRIAGFAWRTIVWPLRTLTRLTPDGALFLGLAMVCWWVSFLSPTWSNIPLLISMVLISLWLLALWQGTRSLRR